MSTELVQINAIREILEGAEQRIDAMKDNDLTPDGRTARARSLAACTLAVAEVARLEEHESKKKADDGGIPTP